MPATEAAPAHRNITLELTVNNHPGVMSHICGLFARRAFNVEGILCMPIEDGERSCIWLLVKDDGRLEQMEKQAAKLADVVEVRRAGAAHDVFVHLEDFFGRDTEERHTLRML